MLFSAAVHVCLQGTSRPYFTLCDAWGSSSRPLVRRFQTDLQTWTAESESPRATPLGVSLCKGCDWVRPSRLSPLLQGRRQLAEASPPSPLPRLSSERISRWLRFFTSCCSPEGLFSWRERPRIALHLSGDPGRPPSPNTTPDVRSPPPRFASRGKCVPFRLPYAGRGGDRTIVPTAAGEGERGGGRSRAALCFPAGSSSSRETNVQTTRVKIILSWDSAQEGGTTIHSS